MRRLSLLFSAVLFALGAAVPAVAFAKADKVDICRLEGNGTYRLISVNGNGNAVRAHLAHGDGLPGQAVPTAPGSVFGQQCSLVPLLILVTSPDPSGNEHLVTRWEDTNLDGRPSAGDTVRTSEFPLFTDSTGARIYIPATVTTHTVTNVVTVVHNPGDTRIEAFTTEDGHDMFATETPFGHEERFFSEEGPDGLVGATDSPDDSAVLLDGTSVHEGAPSEPAITGAHDQSAPNPVHFLEIAYFGTW